MAVIEPKFKCDVCGKEFQILMAGDTLNEFLRTRTKRWGGYCELPKGFMRVTHHGLPRKVVAVNGVEMCYLCDELWTAIFEEEMGERWRRFLDTQGS